MRKMIENESYEDVIRIVRFGLNFSISQFLSCSSSYLLALLLCDCCQGKGRISSGTIARVLRLYPSLELLASVCVRGLKIVFESAQFRIAFLTFNVFFRSRIEQQRWLFKLIKNEHQDTQE